MNIWFKLILAGVLPATSAPFIAGDYNKHKM
jgi:hypothetical protein